MAVVPVEALEALALPRLRDAARGDDATDDCARTQLFSPFRSPASHLVIRRLRLASAALYSDEFVCVLPVLQVRAV